LAKVLATNRACGECYGLNDALLCSAPWRTQMTASAYYIYAGCDWGSHLSVDDARSCVLVVNAFTKKPETVLAGEKVLPGQASAGRASRRSWKCFKALPFVDSLGPGHWRYAFLFKFASAPFTNARADLRLRSKRSDIFPCDYQPCVTSATERSPSHPTLPLIQHCSSSHRMTARRASRFCKCHFSRTAQLRLPFQMPATRMR
jgi:hypothetical protein